mmetsp:Transcript_45748/g.103853  ORF Transcript_45748/g.103853 Transcript_45748/m.103853 type:complete len:82 (+) Transcript_45748:423-668(+)
MSGVTLVTNKRPGTGVPIAWPVGAGAGAAAPKPPAAKPPRLPTAVLAPIVPEKPVATCCTGVAIGIAGTAAGTAAGMVEKP